MSAEPSTGPPKSIAAAATTDPKHADTFGALGDLELEFEKAEVDILKFTLSKMTPLYTRRDAILQNVPAFWPTVVEVVPEFDQYIAPQDVPVVALIKNITVTRPRPNDEPREFILEITFDAEHNDWFTEKTLTKHFWWISNNSDGWSGMVSEPVEITWREGRDLTNGETARAYAAWKARKDGGKGKGKAAAANGVAGKGKSVEERLAGGQLSWFTWFAWIGRGRDADRHDEDGEGKADDAFEDGDELAIVIADDVYVNCVKYFLEALSGGDDADSDSEMSVSELDSASDEEEGTEEEEGGEGEGEDSDDEAELHIVGAEEDDESEEEAGGSSSRVKRHDITLSDDEEADEGRMRRKRVKK
ncbi:hypothetical protein ABW21_db0207687 [Orbilia brochopaga]|nr:hypothetical protein ABW21_db0207687 [Drechslerella brochopaga]